MNTSPERSNDQSIAARELAQNTAMPFEQAVAMPSSVYTSDAFLQQELKHVFGHDWFCAGRASSLSKPGDYLTLELAGQPIMVVRKNDNSLQHGHMSSMASYGVLLRCRRTALFARHNTPCFYPLFAARSGSAGSWCH